MDLLPLESSTVSLLWPRTGLINHCMTGQNLPSFVLINKVLLQHGHTPIFTYCLWPLLCYNDRGVLFQQSPYSPPKPGTFTIWSFTDEFERRDMENNASQTLWWRTRFVFVQISSLLWTDSFLKCDKNVACLLCQTATKFLNIYSFILDLPHCGSWTNGLQTGTRLGQTLSGCRTCLGF